MGRRCDISGAAVRERPREGEGLLKSIGHTLTTPSPSPSNCPKRALVLSGASIAPCFLCLISSFFFSLQSTPVVILLCLSPEIIMQSTAQQSITFPRRRNAPANLGIKITPPPANLTTVVVAEGDSPSPSGPPSDSESVSLRSPTKPRSVRNVKRLSLTLQTKPSTNSLTVATQDQLPVPPSPALEPRRRPSVVSLPATTTLLRQREDDSPSVPYADGPIEILPGIWLGSEDSARDWRGLIKRGIKSILNVAKEVVCPIDASTSKSLRSSVSTSDLSAEPQDSKPTYFPAHILTGRPGLHYLKLPWSHGQPDLVNVGLPAAFDFVDKSISRGDGILIQWVFQKKFPPYLPLT